jgi:energy-coupling factor transporter ATP-binding protein EcfA2
MVEQIYFTTYEQLVEHLEIKTGFAPPKIIEGKQQFLGKFNRWFINFEDLRVEGVNWRCIFPDPRLNIAYPYPIDELTVACSLSNTASASRNAESILSQYNIDSMMSKRQTSTLSGGELLLLSFAKAESMKEITEIIYICTPTQWLHSSKYHLLDNLISSFTRADKTVQILLLEGEQINTNIDVSSSSFPFEPTDEIASLPWSLNLQNLVKVFDANSFPKESDEKTLKYIPNEYNKEFNSPTLLTGDNGVGKSVFVKMLSNIYEPTSGTLTIRCLGNEGYARVLMQDSLDQLFGETIDSHFNRVFQFDKEKGKQAKDLYEKMLNDLREKVKHNSSLRKIKLAASHHGGTETILQVKFALVCERLISKPPLLILDEPDWCLSRPITMIFISIVVKAAHHYHVPILIITHLSSWYTGLFNSVLDLKKIEDSQEINLEDIADGSIL